MAEPRPKKRKMSYSSDNTKNTNNTIAIQSNKNIKQKVAKPIQYSFDSLTINNFIISGYIGQTVKVLFGKKIIAIQWKIIKQKQCKSNYKLYDKTPTKRINIKFDSIEYINSNKYNNKILYFKLKYPPHFTEQACPKLMDSHQKSNQFSMTENDPTKGNATKYKKYEIILSSKVEKFITKIQQNSEILKQIIANGAVPTSKNDIIFNAQELKQNDTKIKKQINETKTKYLSVKEVDEILICLGVKRNECKNVNHCLRVAISKKYIGIKNGKCKLDIDGGLNQKIKKLCWLPECMEVTLERLIDQPLMGDDYEDGGYTQGAAVCIDKNCDGDYCGGTQYITNLCRGKPELDNGKGHNHCQKCKQCMGDYRNRHCDKCGVHDAWWGKCSNCDKSDID